MYNTIYTVLFMQYCLYNVFYIMFFIQCYLYNVTYTMLFIYGGQNALESYNSIQDSIRN